MSETQYAILGANVAGISSAINLSKYVKPENIFLYEANYPYNKTCGGAISIEFYNYLKDMYGVVIGEHYCPQTLRIGFMNGKSLEFNEQPFYVSTRLDIQSSLIEYIKKETDINFIIKRVQPQDYDIFTPQTIVASGYSGLSHSLLNRVWRKGDDLPVVRFDGIVDRNEVDYPDEIIMLPDLDPLGYGWLFVGEGNHVNIGYGAIGTAKEIRNRYYEFLDILNTHYGCRINPEAVKPVGWGIPMPVKKNYPVYNNKTINGKDYQFIGVGDTIGLAHPVFGAGIEPAWLSGFVLAESLDYHDKIDVEEYQKLVYKNVNLTSQRKRDRKVNTFVRSRLFKILPMGLKIKMISRGLKWHIPYTIENNRKYPWYEMQQWS